MPSTLLVLTLLLTTSLAEKRWFWPNATTSSVQGTIPLGTIVNFQWEYDYTPFNLTLFQGPGSVGRYSQQRFLPNWPTNQRTNYTWEVKLLRGRPLSECFHAELESDDPDAGEAFRSGTFCASERSEGDPVPSGESDELDEPGDTASSPAEESEETTSPPAEASGGGGGGSKIALGVGLGLGIPGALALGALGGFLLFRRRNKRAAAVEYRKSDEPDMRESALSDMGGNEPLERENAQPKVEADSSTVKLELTGTEPRIELEAPEAPDRRT